MSVTNLVTDIINEFLYLVSRKIFRGRIRAQADPPAGGRLGEVPDRRRKLVLGCGGKPEELAVIFRKPRETVDFQSVVRNRQPGRARRAAAEPPGAK